MRLFRAYNSCHRRFISLIHYIEFQNSNHTLQSYLSHVQFGHEQTGKELTGNSVGVFVCNVEQHSEAQIRGLRVSSKGRLLEESRYLHWCHQPTRISDIFILISTEATIDHGGAISPISIEIFIIVWPWFWSYVWLSFWWDQLWDQFSLITHNFCYSAQYLSGSIRSRDLVSLFYTRLAGYATGAAWLAEAEGGFGLEAWRRRRRWGLLGTIGWWLGRGESGLVRRLDSIGHWSKLSFYATDINMLHTRWSGAASLVWL